eukprot:TRINITY_DN24622_c0_g2_i1.p1 TRINITY_DN24622_c0_g2~~TRINITY_DN24622_c0_g2_i1.p1  ORF type:complete len:893 (+),score=311.22 TRINITY_DN24622_c0_g2_i1:38-2716(+)
MQPPSSAFAGQDELAVDSDDVMQHDEVYVGIEDKETCERLEEYDRGGMTLSADGEARLLRSLLEPLERRRGSLEESASRQTRRERDAISQTVAGMQEEANTLGLLRLLIFDTLRDSSPEGALPSVDGKVLPPQCPAHRKWAASHRDTLAVSLASGWALRRAVLLLVWLEQVYAESHDSFKEEYVANGFRKHTIQLLQSDGPSKCPTTGRPLVSSSAFDAPQREMAHVHPVDEEAERALYTLVLGLIRAGRIAEARAACEEKGHGCLAALLQESTDMLHHIPGAQAPVEVEGLGLPDAVAERCGLAKAEAYDGTTRFSYFAAILDLVDNQHAPGGAAHSAVFASLVGKSDAMLGGFRSPSFRDHLWASVRGFIEHSLHTLFYPLLKGHEDCDEEDAWAVLSKTKPLHTSLAQFAVEAEQGTSDPHASLQAALVRLFGEGPKATGAAFDAVFVLLDSQVAEHSPRLAAHVAMQLWRCRDQLLGSTETCSDATADLLDSVLTRYSHHLYRTYPDQPDLLLSAIPYLASKMSGTGVEVASQFCVVLGPLVSDPDASRTKLLARFSEVGLDSVAIQTGASRLLCQGTQALAQWGVSAAAEDPAIESIRALTFIPEQSLSALQAFNTRCRALVSEILGAGVRLSEAGDSLEAADNAMADQRRSTASLQHLFDKVFCHLKQQFETQQTREAEGGVERALLLNERMEAQHWDVYTQALQAMLEWRGVSEQEPVPLEWARPANSYEAAAHKAHVEKLRRQHEEWMLREWRARHAFKSVATKMLTREYAPWLVDLQSVEEGLDAQGRAVFGTYLQQRKGSLLYYRQHVIPGLVSTLLEMFATHAAHLSQEQMREESSCCNDVVDSLVSDGVTESLSLMECFPSVTQSSRIVGYIARIQSRCL